CTYSVQLRNSYSDSRFLNMRGPSRAQNMIARFGGAQWSSSTYASLRINTIARMQHYCDRAGFLSRCRDRKARLQRIPFTNIKNALNGIYSRKWHGDQSVNGRPSQAAEFSPRTPRDFLAVG